MNIKAKRWHSILYYTNILFLFREKKRFCYFLPDNTNDVVTYHRHLIASNLNVCDLFFFFFDLSLLKFSWNEEWSHSGKFEALPAFFSFLFSLTSFDQLISKLDLFPRTWSISFLGLCYFLYHCYLVYLSPKCKFRKTCRRHVFGRS